MIQIYSDLNQHDKRDRAEPSELLNAAAFLVRQVESSHSDEFFIVLIPPHYKS